MQNRLDYKKIVLPNGLTCILYKRSELHSISISIEVDVGSLDETKETNGISHLLEHLPFDGTEELPSWEKVDEFNNSISGSSNAYTSSSTTNYYGFYPYQYAKEALFYLSQLVFHPLFKEEDIEKEKEIIKDELKSRSDSIDYKVYRGVIDNRYTDTNNSYSFDVIGTEENIKRFTREEIVAHHNKYYVPSNIKIFIVGNFNDDSIEELLNEYFYLKIKDKSFNESPTREFLEVYPDYSTFRISADQKKDLDQYYLTVTFPRPEFKLTSEEKRLKLNFLSAITASGQYQQSVLWKKLREELGIVYGVSAYGWDYYNRAFTIIETSFQPQYLTQVLEEIYAGLNTIKESNINDIVFKTRQKRIIDTELMIYDSPSNVLSWIADQEKEFEFHKKFLTPDQYIEFVKNLEFKEIIELANEVYDWSKANINIVTQNSPKKLKKEVETIWKKIIKK